MNKAWIAATLSMLGLWSCAISGPREARPFPAAAWREAHDFDGDGVRDVIVIDFSGGAHCCYTVGVYLSSRGQTLRLPFQLDGGLSPGQDLIDRPERFSLREEPDDLPEIVMEIETYNGEPSTLHPAWRRRWGVRSHRVAACFAGGRLRLRDESGERAPCRFEND